MSDISPELNQAPQNKDQARSGKNIDRSIKTRLKNLAGKAILRVPPLVALIASSDNIHNQIVPEQIGNPTPAIAQAPDFKSQTDYTLTPSTPQPPAETSTLKSTPEPTPTPSIPNPTEMPTPTIPPTPTQEVKPTSQAPQQEQSEKKELIPYSPSITIIDAAPSIQKDGLIQKEFISNDEMIRNMLGEKYISKEQIIQEFGPNYEEKWDEVVGKYPQALVYRFTDIYFNHGENVARVAEDILERSGLQSTGISILPLQETFDGNSIAFIKDASGNPGVSLNFDPKRIIELLKNDPNTVINGSFQVGNVELFQEVHKQLGVVREYDKWDDPRRYPLGSVIDGDKTVYYPGGRTNEKNGIYTGKFYDAEGKEVEPITLEDFESGRVKNPELKIIKFSEISTVGAYTQKKAMENLPKLFEVASAYPDKFFVFALGNEGEDIRDAMETLKDKVPKNLLITAEWIEYDYGYGVYRGPSMNYLKYAPVYGPDIYVFNKGSQHPSGSSFSAPELSAEIDILLKKGLSVEQAREKILASSVVYTDNLRNKSGARLEDKVTFRVFNPSKLHEK